MKKIIFLLLLSTAPFFSIGQDLSLLIGKWCLISAEVRNYPYYAPTLTEYSNCEITYEFFSNGKFEIIGASRRSTGIWTNNIQDLDLMTVSVYLNDSMIHFRDSTRYDSWCKFHTDKVLILTPFELQIKNTYMPHGESSTNRFSKFIAK